jgi:23S rRNA pseudouridine2605 synthase
MKLMNQERKVMNPITRLNKFLSEGGIASRRKSDELIEQGRVTVNGKTVVELGFKIDEANDDVRLDGEKVHSKSKVYYMLNKPKGTVTTTEDEKGRTTVVELIRSNEKIFPVGRLDYNTTGLLLLTNDGEFTNYLTHPKNKFVREYVVKLSKPLTKEDKLRLEQGIYLDKRKSKFASILFYESKNYNRVIVKTEEGRNHFIKRMFGALGYFVEDLNRVSFGPFKLQNLRVGESKKLSGIEVKKILNMNK